MSDTRTARFYDVDDNFVGEFELDSYTTYKISAIGKDSVMFFIRKIPYGVEEVETLDLKNKIFPLINSLIKRIAITEKGTTTTNTFLAEMKPFYSFTPNQKGAVEELGIDSSVDFFMEEIKFLEDTEAGIPHTVTIL